MHKEYIEREAVKEKIERLRDKCGNNEMAFALNWAVSLTGKIPAADVVPVRHGKWIDEIDPWDRQHIGKCSECGQKYRDFMHFCFCPNCGAKMDKDSDEG